MKPPTNLLFTTLIVLLLRTVIGQSNQKHSLISTPTNRFPQLQKVFARLPGGAPSPAPAVLSPWSSQNARSEGARTASDAGQYSAPQPSASASARSGGGAAAAPKEHRSYPTLATSKLQPPERTQIADGRMSGGRALDSAPPMSGYSEFKWNVMGRSSSFEAYRQSRMNATGKQVSPLSKDDTFRATQHAQLMSTKTVCKVPRPKVVNVKDVHPHPGRIYTPACTLLHRCGDDTACCKADTHSCRASRKEDVELYFYSSMSIGRSNVVVPLIFVNHTECSCQDKYEDMPRDQDTGPPTRPYAGPYQGPHQGPHQGHYQGVEATHARHRHAPPAWTSSRAPRWPQTEFEEEPSASSRLESCRCPKEFHSRRTETSCTCECFDRQHECLHLKRGTRYFPYQDKICIEKRHCQPPLCEFGPYLHESGRCARKHEFSSWSQTSGRRETFH